MDKSEQTIPAIGWRELSDVDSENLYRRIVAAWPMGCDMRRMFGWSLDQLMDVVDDLRNHGFLLLKHHTKSDTYRFVLAPGLQLLDIEKSDLEDQRNKLAAHLTDRDSVVRSHAMH